MSWYTSSENCVNTIPVPSGWRQQIVCGQHQISQTIANSIVRDIASRGRACLFGLDGYKGVKFQPLIDGISKLLSTADVEVVLFNVDEVFYSKAKIDKIVRNYERPKDPSFGRVFPGSLQDLMDPKKMRRMMVELGKLRQNEDRKLAVICYGMGAATPAWRHLLDRTAYCDITREQILIRSDRNEVPLVGGEMPQGFPWKRIYYVEYPALNRHKKEVLKAVDWFLDTSSEQDPKMIPSDVYHALITELSSRPLSFKVFYMPGTFGGQEFGKRFHVKGLPNTSWDFEISVGDNHLLVDIGDGLIFEFPFYNLLWEQPLRVLGTYSSTTYPDHFPIAIYMQDGYFPPGDTQGFKRTHMPNHLHPDSAYCHEHFGEPLGRYETYYIVRADEGACTMHGFKDDADIGEYVQEVKKSSKTGKEFDWRKYIYEHPSKTGELHQLPPGTVHGTGGRQIILEIDTNPSRESTEYSFYLYDYCRQTFNYEKNDFSGRPAKLHIAHSLAVMRHNRKQKFMATNCRAEPVCVRSGPDWREVSFPMYYNMPYQINRFEFETTIEDDTRDMFHCLALTLGNRVRVYSKHSPSNEFIMEDCDNVVLPACFGEYVCENLGDGPCQVIKTFLITEPRSHIDKTQEESDWVGEVRRV